MTKILNIILAHVHYTRTLILRFASGARRFTVLAIHLTVHLSHKKVCPASSVVVRRVKFLIDEKKPGVGTVAACYYDNLR